MACRYSTRLRDRIASVLLPLLIWSSIFQAAAVYNLKGGENGYPIGPYLCSQLLACMGLCLAIAWSKGRIILSRREATGFLGILSWFCIYALFTSQVMPRLFTGMGVYSPAIGIDSQYNNLTPLKVGLSQTAQAGLLLLNFLMVNYFYVHAGKRRIPDLLHLSLITAFFIVAFFSIWQMASSLTGLYFPSEILYSSTGRFQGHEQSMGGVSRVNSTFLEASGLGVYLIGAIAYVLRYVTQCGGRFYWMLLGLMVLSALISTSSSAYLGLLVLSFFYAAYVIKSVLMRGRVSSASLLIAAALPLASLAGLGTYLTSDLVRRLFNAIVLSKSDSESFVHRYAADARAYEIFKDTAGLGVGLGANRPSSFMASLLSDVGLVGSALFLLLVVTVLRQAGRAVLRSPCTTHERAILSASRWGMGFCLFGMVIAIPDLSYASLWVWIGVTGCLTQYHLLSAKSMVSGHGN